MASSNVSIILSNQDSLGGALDFFIRVGDESGASYINVPDQEIQNWAPLLASDCAEICWDLRIFDDGDSKSHRDLTPSVTIRGSSGVKATFKANFTVSEAGGSNPGWHRICAPVRPLENGQLPDDSTGTWMVTPSPAAWNGLIGGGISGIIFPNFDTTGIDEKVDYDNICVEPCCLEQKTVQLLCEVDDTGTSSGDFLWTFEVKNLSGMAVHHLFIVDLPPGVIVDRPQILFQPPIPDQGVRVETVRISNAMPGETLHFRFTFHDESMDGCCDQRVWLELPLCECAQVVEDAVAFCVKPPSPPTFQYSFELQNLSSKPIGSILLAPVTMSGSPLLPNQLVLQPNFLPLSPTIASGGTTLSLPVAISGPLALEGEKVCFRISTHDPDFEECCSIVRCARLPFCLTKIKDPPPKQ